MRKCNEPPINSRRPTTKHSRIWCRLAHHHFSPRFSYDNILSLFLSHVLDMFFLFASLGKGERKRKKNGSRVPVNVPCPSLSVYYTCTANQLNGFRNSLQPVERTFHHFDCADNIKWVTRVGWGTMGMQESKRLWIEWRTIPKKDFTNFIVTFVSIAAGKKENKKQRKHSPHFQ